MTVAVRAIAAIGTSLALLELKHLTTAPDGRTTVSAGDAQLALAEVRRHHELPIYGENPEHLPDLLDDRRTIALKIDNTIVHTTLDDRLEISISNANDQHF